MKINWKVRFNKNNLLFIIRFLVALAVPVFSYLGLEAKDLNSWDILINTALGCLKNPYLIGLIIINAINLLPDPTTEGIGDSEKALTYSKPAKNSN